jgi:hypothetical protein
MALQEKTPELKHALQIYCTRKMIDTATLAEILQCGYQHAWNLLNGKAPVTVETLGRFLLGFGAEESAALLKLAGSPNDRDRRTVQEA